MPEQLAALPSFPDHLRHLIDCYQRDHPLVDKVEIHVHPWLIPALREAAIAALPSREREFAKGESLVAFLGQPIIADPAVMPAGICMRQARIEIPAIARQLSPLPPRRQPVFDKALAARNGKSIYGDVFDASSHAVSGTDEGL